MKSFVVLPQWLLYSLLGLFIALAALVVLAKLFLEPLAEEGGGLKKTDYKYTRKQFFMTRAEKGFYNRLVEAVSGKYMIFAQVHLATLLEHKVRGQNWKAAFRHINGKSVDFVLCDNQYLNPLLAIELDDNSHDRPDRQKRDGEVERIFAEANVPLLRIRYSDNLPASELAARIAERLML